MNVGSLFTGIGGFDLGFERAGMRIEWQCEVEPYACAVLRKHWPNIPNLGDISRIESAPAIDVLCGGFPCQDISVAGRGIGIDGERSGLWREYARLIRLLRPRWIVAENVPALRTRGYDRVADDLEAAGYTVQTFVVGADDIGAPHRRKRVWIAAYSESLGRSREGEWRQSEFAGVRSTSEVEFITDAAISRREGANRFGESIETRRDWSMRCATADTNSESPDWFAIARGQRGYGQPKPTIRRVDDGLPNRLDENRRPRLAALGNSLVPQIAEMVGRAIMNVEKHI